TILLFFLSATDNKLLRLLVVSSLVSLCFPTPGRAGMTTSGGLPFASTHRVIDWIHRDSAYLRATAPPACRSCLSVGHIFMICIADRSNRGSPQNMYSAHLSRRQADLSVVCLFRDQLCGGAGTSRQLSPSTPS